LIIEDDEDLATVFDRIARSIAPDAVVEWASTAEEAIARLRNGSYSAVLADYLLPGPTNGLAMRALSRRLQPEASFALMSAFPMTDAIGRRPCPFLRKPFTSLECHQFLRTLLTRSRASRRRSLARRSPRLGKRPAAARR
jgi:DNA-binding NtrC family response regulator